ncbi:MAG: XkdF-like putative serine protease domain-containing protein [Rikenellaceae bacterium]|nr:XkdF-like putative serine protease domain-containing protein [Rikenellaceae bacterium]
MKKKIPIYEAKVKGTDNTGIFAMSFVELPANESNFVALQRQRPVKLSIDKHKQLLTGVVLIPDQLIYRNDVQLGEYYLKFTAAEIERIALKMMRTGVALTTTTHQHEKPLKGNYLAELWIVKDSKRDKSVALGLGELPVGTLVASYKIENPAYWRTEVLTGNVKGFSLEGIFNFNSVQMKKNPKTAAQLAKEQAAAKNKGKGIPAFFRSVAAFLEGESEAAAEGVAEEAKKDETDSGTPYLIFELGEGGEVWVDEDGFCTLEGGEQMPAGEHALADGNVIVVDDSGMLVITQPEADGAEPAEADVAMAKRRAKAFLKSQNPNATEIAKLKAQIAELEKQPSTGKATPDVDGGGKGGKKPEEMTYTEKMAAVIASRRERQDAKKNKK